ncbi:MAG: hypothetical protein K2P94_10215 [Rhodospirillaceae bacterium]|nr:hypothetical protein [Rhodospirillaceae bacterium]
MVRKYRVAGVLLFAGLASGAAKAEPYLEGRFDIVMKESHWAGEPPLVDAFWVFEQDDGKRRRSHLVHYRKDGRLNIGYYDDVPYDGKMYWLNDWYRESNTMIDWNTFSYEYELQMAGMPKALTGKGLCKINEPRTRIHCTIGGSVEVYEKKGK